MENQLNIFNQQTPKVYNFKGSDYIKELDHDRLSKQIERIYDLMKDGNYRTLFHIKNILELRYGTPFPESSISAQLRNLKKVRFGGYVLNKKRISGGLWEYQIR